MPRWTSPICLFWNRIGAAKSSTSRPSAIVALHGDALVARRQRLRVGQRVLLVDLPRVVAAADHALVVGDGDVVEVLPAERLLDEDVDRRPVLGQHRHRVLRGHELRQRSAVALHLVQHRRVLLLVEERRGDGHRRRHQHRHHHRPAHAQRNAPAPPLLVLLLGELLRHADQRRGELLARLEPLSGCFLSARSTMRRRLSGTSGRSLSSEGGSVLVIL